jgi:hypothetical protein
MAGREGLGEQKGDVAIIPTCQCFVARITSLWSNQSLGRRTLDITNMILSEITDKSMIQSIPVEGIGGLPVNRYANFAHKKQLSICYAAHFGGLNMLSRQDPVSVLGTWSQFHGPSQLAQTTAFADLICKRPVARRKCQCEER